MALQDGQVLGTWGNGGTLKVKKVGTKFYLQQVVQATPYEVFVIRGGSLINDSAVVRAANFPTQTDIETLEGYTANGFVNPGYVAEAAYEPFSLPDGTPAFRNTAQFTAYKGVTDLNNDGVDDNATRSAKLLEDPIAWAKENPVLAAALVVGLFLAYKSFFGKKGRKKSVLGLF